jgi:hypothetical protein
VSGSSFPLRRVLQGEDHRCELDRLEAGPEHDYDPADIYSASLDGFAQASRNAIGAIDDALQIAVNSLDDTLQRVLGLSPIRVADQVCALERLLAIPLALVAALVLPGMARPGSATGDRQIATAGGISGRRVPGRFGRSQPRSSQLPRQSAVT